MILKTLGAGAVAILIGTVLAGAITGLVGVWAPEAALATIPLTWVAIMVMTHE
jgi:hypothetical protein